MLRALLFFSLIVETEAVFAWLFGSESSPSSPNINKFVGELEGINSSSQKRAQQAQDAFLDSLAEYLNADSDSGAQEQTVLSNRFSYLLPQSVNLAYFQWTRILTEELLNKVADANDASDPHHAAPHPVNEFVHNVYLKERHEWEAIQKEFGGSMPALSVKTQGWAEHLVHYAQTAKPDVTKVSDSHLNGKPSVQLAKTLLTVGGSVKQQKGKHIKMVAPDNFNEEQFSALVELTAASMAYHGADEYAAFTLKMVDDVVRVLLKTVGVGKKFPSSMKKKAQDSLYHFQALVGIVIRSQEHKFVSGLYQDANKNDFLSAMQVNERKGRAAERAGVKFLGIAFNTYNILVSKVLSNKMANEENACNLFQQKMNQHVTRIAQARTFDEIVLLISGDRSQFESLVARREHVRKSTIRERYSELKSENEASRNARHDRRAEKRARRENKAMIAQQEAEMRSRLQQSTTSAMSESSSETYLSTPLVLAIIVLAIILFYIFMVYCVFAKQSKKTRWERDFNNLTDDESDFTDDEEDYTTTVTETQEQTYVEPVQIAQMYALSASESAQQWYGSLNPQKEEPQSWSAWAKNKVGY